MNTLPNFNNVFFYGRWANDLSEKEQFIALFKACSNLDVAFQEISNIDAQGFMICADPDDCNMRLNDIMYFVETFRKLAPSYMKQTQIDNFSWSGDTAYIELSCL